MTLYPEFPERTSEDPLPAAIGSRVGLASERETRLISVKETPDTIMANDFEGCLIWLEIDPIRIAAGRRLITHVEPAPPGELGGTLLHLFGRALPVRVLTTVEQIAERLGRVTE